MAVTFPAGSPASEAEHKVGLLPSAMRESLPVHPTQLYESAASFAIAAFLILWLHGKKRYDGQVFIAFVALYGGARFLIEFLRADDRGAIAGLSTSQLLSLALFGAAYYFHKKRSEIHVRRKYHLGYARGADALRHVASMAFYLVTLRLARLSAAWGRFRGILSGG